MPVSATESLDYRMSFHCFNAASLKCSLSGAHDSYTQLTAYATVVSSLGCSNRFSALTTNLLERRKQLDADEAEFIAPDVLEQESVVFQVFIGQVVLYLSYELLGQFRVRGLPALLLELSATSASTTKEDIK